VSDRSLDEFAVASTGDDDPADAADDDEPVADEASTPAADDADPRVPTMRWSADGDACDDCGTVVSRRWRDGDDVVCADCKEW